MGQHKRGWAVVGIMAVWLAGTAAYADVNPDATLIPGQSIADSDMRLYRDVMRGFSGFVTTEYNCAPWTVLDTRRVNAQGILQLNEQGQVVQGYIEERWATDICGDKVDLRVSIEPRNDWGTVVRFERL